VRWQITSERFRPGLKLFSSRVGRRRLDFFSLRILQLKSALEFGSRAGGALIQYSRADCQSLRSKVAPLREQQIDNVPGAISSTENQMGWSKVSDSQFEDAKARGGACPGVGRLPGAAGSANARQFDREAGLEVEPDSGTQYSKKQRK
jgi:hypothetical protein